MQKAFHLDSKVVSFAGSVPCWPQHIRQTKSPECALTRNLPPRVLILLSFLSEVVFSVPVCIVEHMCDFCLYCIAHLWKDFFYIDLTCRITIHCIVSDVHKRMQMILSRNASRISCTESFFSCLPSIQPFVELPVYKERERASETHVAMTVANVESILVCFPVKSTDQQEILPAWFHFGWYFLPFW